MVDVAQLVRASDCGSEGRGFEPLLPPARSLEKETFFVFQEVPFLAAQASADRPSLQFPGSLHNARPDSLKPNTIQPQAVPVPAQFYSGPSRLSPSTTLPQTVPASAQFWSGPSRPASISAQTHFSPSRPQRKSAPAALKRPSERVNLRRSPPSEANPPQQPQKKRENVAILPLCFRVGFPPPFRKAPPHPLNYLR